MIIVGHAPKIANSLCQTPSPPQPLHHLHHHRHNIIIVTISSPCHNVHPQHHGLGHMPQPDNFTTIGNNLGIEINQYNCPIDVSRSSEDKTVGTITFLAIMCYIRIWHKRGWCKYIVEWCNNECTLKLLQMQTFLITGLQPRRSCWDEGCDGEGWDGLPCHQRTT